MQNRDSVALFAPRNDDPAVPQLLYHDRSAVLARCPSPAAVQGRKAAAPNRGLSLRRPGDDQALYVAVRLDGEQGAVRELAQRRPLLQPEVHGEPNRLVESGTGWQQLRRRNALRAARPVTAHTARDEN